MLDLLCRFIIKRTIWCNYNTLNNSRIPLANRPCLKYFGAVNIRKSGGIVCVFCFYAIYKDIVSDYKSGMYTYLESIEWPDQRKTKRNIFQKTNPKGHLSFYS